MTKAALTYPRRGLHGEVVYTIGRRIVSGELKPGALLPPEEELTADFDASRTVLREAVRVLAAKGLVEARPKTGTRVRRREEWNILDPDVLSWRVVGAAHDPQLYTEMTEVRLAIEPIATRLAATRMTDDELTAVEEAYLAMEEGVTNQAAYLAADLQFHDRILGGCHNEFLTHLGVVLRAVLQNTFELTTKPRSSRKRALPLHRGIYEGLAARDEDRAEAAARALIADTTADIQRIARRMRKSG